nr:protein kinase-like domain, phloem protein 2-like protein [Tanacetum cinerariifolium]
MSVVLEKLKAALKLQEQEEILKDEHEQVLEDEKRSDDSLQWTMKRGVFSCLPNRFYSQRRYAVDKDGKKSLIFSVRGATRFDSVFFKSSPESRFFFYFHAANFLEVVKSFAIH